MNSIVRSGVVVGFAVFVFGSVGSNAQPAPAAKDDSALLVEGDPIVKNWVVPEYPSELLAAKIQGDVVVHMIVDENGSPSKLQVAKTTDARFNDAVLKAFAACTFTPAVEQGKAIAAGVRMSWHFGLPYHPSKQMPPQESYPKMLPKTPAMAETTASADYPESLVNRRLDGEVLFQLEVGADGAVVDPRILAVSHPDFVRPALDAVRQWKFKPALQGDLPVKDAKRVPFSFTYQGPEPTEKKTQLEMNEMELDPSTAGTFTVAPVIAAIADPVFPSELLKSNESGDAEVTFTVGIQGLPEDVVLKSATYPACGASLVAAVEATAFTPAMSRGQAVRVKFLRKHHFAPPAEVAQPGESGEMRILRTLRAGETILGAKGLDAKLRPVWRAAPAYPSALRATRPSGTASIEFIIDKEGRVRAPRIVSATQEEFGWAAATALAQWVFEPLTRGGLPTDVRVQVPFNFSPP